MSCVIDGAAPVCGQGTGGNDLHDGLFPPRKQPDPLTGKLALSNAEAAFDAYFDEYTARFGTTYPEKVYGQNKNWPVFVQLAVICAARGWDPADYVHSLFLSKEGTECMLIKDLTKKKYLDAYRPSLDKPKAHEEYERCIELLIQGETEGASEKALLLSPLSAFPAWFRVFYPEQIDLEVVDAWGGIAKQEIAQSSELLGFLQRIDPGKWDRVRKALWFYGELDGGTK